MFLYFKYLITLVLLSPPIAMALEPDLRGQVKRHFQNHGAALNDKEQVAITEALVHAIQDEDGFIVPDSTRIRDATRILETILPTGTFPALSRDQSLPVLQGAVSGFRENTAIPAEVKDSLNEDAARYTAYYKPRAELKWRMGCAFFCSAEFSRDRCGGGGLAQGPMPPEGRPYRLERIEEQIYHNEPGPNSGGYTLECLPSNQDVQSARVSGWANRPASGTARYQIALNLILSHRIPAPPQAVYDETLAHDLRAVGQKLEGEAVPRKTLEDGLIAILNDPNAELLTDEDIWNRIRPLFEGYDRYYDQLLIDAENARCKAQIYQSAQITLVDTVIAHIEERKDFLSAQAIEPFLVQADLADWMREPVPAGTYHYGAREVRGFDATRRHFVNRYHP